MTKITREEVVKLAQLSRVELKEEEIDLVTKQLQDVLNYAQRVNEIAQDIQVDFGKNINIFAQDIIERTKAEPLLAQAPEREDNFFVVPRIIEDK
jgi:aspartyl-tRNA(Asn)/glutamyl-tRNA(Gln) amidotransferase subunit C